MAQSAVLPSLQIFDVGRVGRLHPLGIGSSDRLRERSRSPRKRVEPPPNVRCYPIVEARTDLAHVQKLPSSSRAKRKAAMSRAPARSPPRRSGPAGCTWP
jgi:hypothetical protein